MGAGFCPRQRFGMKEEKEKVRQEHYEINQK